MAAQRRGLRLVGIAIVVSLLALMTGCGQRTPGGGDAGASSKGSVPHQLKKSDLTAPQRQYGIAPKMGLGVQHSTLSASGDYTFTGSFKAGCYNGLCNAAGPGGFTSRQSMAHNTSGLSLSAEGLNLANQLRVIVGAFRGSDIGNRRRSAKLVLLNGGAGLPQPRRSSTRRLRARCSGVSFFSSGA